MGILHNPLLKDFHGHIGKTIVIRQYPGKTVISAYPDMSRVVASEKQKQQRSKLKEAQQLAAQMLKDPGVKAQYKARCKGKQRPYDLLRAEIMKGIVPGL